MTPRAKLLALVVAALAAGNAVRWTWQPGVAGAAYTAAEFAFKPEDFGWPSAAGEGLGLARRDLFQLPKVAQTARPKALGRQPVKREELPVPASADQLAQTAAQEELTQIKLMGLVFRDGRGQAYLVKGDEVFLVSAGEAVGSRFRVERISSDAVQLRDPVTQVGGWVAVTGN